MPTQLLHTTPRTPSSRKHTDSSVKSILSSETRLSANDNERHKYLADNWMVALIYCKFRFKRPNAIARSSAQVPHACRRSTRSWFVHSCMLYPLIVHFVTKTARESVSRIFYIDISLWLSSLVMSLKQEIETWVRALEHYDYNEYDAALRAFMTVADTSKILFNCAVIHATLGEHTQAVHCYQRAIHFDQYMAIAYFQQGVSNFLLGDFEEALANFNDTLLYLRGNRWIDYDQLGLKFKLHSCEALFNRGLCYIYLQQRSAGLQDLFYASKEKAVPDHDVIDEAIREKAEGYTVFSIPVGILYRPNEAKVKNIKSKNYLGTSTLVRAQDRSNQVYLDSHRNLTAASFAVDDRPEEKLSYAAINLNHLFTGTCFRRHLHQKLNGRQRRIRSPTVNIKTCQAGSRTSCFRARVLINHESGGRETTFRNQKICFGKTESTRLAAFAFESSESAGI
ncbi:hypothetical protein KCU81_g393, partial [Aureobasidium melanogenum]